MLKKVILSAAICIFAVFPPWLKAETHNVSVQNSFFNPNDLVIKAGDTVVWRKTQTRGDCTYGCAPAVLHNVVADDGSFTSGPPDEVWTYSKTFDQPGEVLYHCGEHSGPGRNINNFMNGRITVQAEEEEEEEVEEEVEAVFVINRGLSDAWYFPVTDGQGFLIMVFPGIKQVFVAWFTFDTERPPEDVTAILGEPGHRWLTAQGPYDGDTATLTIFMTQGGVFDSPVPPASTDQAGDGTLTIEFADCLSGLVTYEITSLGISGEIPIQRIVLENVALCETLSEPD